MRIDEKITACVLSTLVLAMGILSGCKQNSQSAGSESNNNSKVVTIEAQTAAPETTRVENLEKAAEKLNEELKKQGKDIRVKVKTKVFEGSWEEYAKQFMLAFKAKKSLIFMQQDMKILVGYRMEITYFL